MQKLKGETKRGIYIMIFSLFIILILISTVSAGWFDWLKKTITGKDTQDVDINISVGGPSITWVQNITTLTGGPTAASRNGVIINFTGYIASGVGNLNHSTAAVNVTYASNIRQNTSCVKTLNSSNYVNYTCNLSIWWWAPSAHWKITAYIQDNNTNGAVNQSLNFSIGSTKGFVKQPPTLNWSALSPGATNETPTNQPILINNTGNFNISVGNMSLNATHLLGEENSAYGLWATNFSISYTTGSDAECGYGTSTNLTNNTFVNISVVNITAGNYTKNDGTSGQEQLYFCLKLIGSELITQSYSTGELGNWIIQL